MTSQKDQIQALIADIDSVLQKTTPRLPWVVSGEMTQQRQILERVRNYLVTIQRQQSVGESYGQAGARPDLLAHDIHYQPTQPPYQAPPIEAQGARSQPYGQDELSAQQMLQAIVHDMGYLRANVMQPLQSDLDVLRQQREALVQEIHQLEAQRQGYAGQLPGNQQQMIAEFLQALMSRLQETLPQQVAQTLRGSNQQFLPSSGNLALSGAAAPIQMTSNPNAQGLGNIQVAQSQSDELLIKLDSTLSVVFESLQRNVQAYEESLSQGLEKMHSMGEQGEMMFTALISHLASQLGQEAATYLQPSTATGSQSATAAQPSKLEQSQSGQSNSGQSNSGQPNVEQPTTATGSQPLRLPFPGTELSSSGAGAGAGAAANRTEPSVDTAIDSWLRSASSADASSTADFELAELNLEGFDLNQLAAQDVNALLELDANLLNTNLPPLPLLAPTEPSNAPTQTANEGVSSATSSGMSLEDTADIDAALQLLEQLSSELQEQPASMADADAQLDQMLRMPSPQTGETAATGIPDDARDELDEFYESLFGDNAIAAAPSSVAPSSEAASATASPGAAAVPVATGTPPVAGTPPVTSNIAADAVDSTYTVTAETTQAPATQPVEALPAETQAAPLTAPALLAAPAVSAGNDPTLGWDLLAKPLTTPAAEPEIPAALLDDELLNGWDFEDTELDLATSEPVTAGKELLGVGETSTTIDPLSVATPSQPGTIAPDSSVSQSPPIAPDAASLPSEAVLSTETSGNPDEITTLADLFDEPLPGGGRETPIAAPVVPTESSRPPVNASSDNTAVTLPASSEQPTSGQPTSGQPTSGQPTSGQPTSGQPSAGQLTSRQPTAGQSTAGQAEDRLGDDRYTPAPLEEDLLPLEEPIDDSDPELWLDESTLNRLSADLFSLEETIGEPSILPYGAEAEANEPVFYPDATIPDTAIPDAAISGAPTSHDATAFHDPTRVNEPTALDHWGASLDDFADSLATPDSTPASTVSEPGAIAAEPPGTFLLEGMDDLFADTPVVPSVTPVPPPVASASESSTAFTLEGMDDLFADALTGSAPLPPTVPTANQPPPFTLEGIDQLFDDVPLVTATPVPSAPNAPSDTSLPFTLEGVDELFADAPPVSNVPPVSTVPPLSTVPPVSNVPLGVGAFSVPEPSIAEVPTPPEPAFTLDTSDQFVAAPTAASPPTEYASDSTIAPSSPTSTAPTSKTIAPFTFEQVGDLFMEVPSEGLPLSGQPMSEPAAATAAQPSEAVPEPVPAPAIAPFTLERVGDVFIERPSEAVSSASPAIASNAPTSPSLPTAESSTAAPATAESSTSQPSTLEQAFASLMGSFDDPMAGADRAETDTTDPEKKK